MSFDSIIFLAFMFAVIAVTTYKFFSEKRPSGSAPLDIGVDVPLSDQPVSYPQFHDSSHHGDCDAGAGHDGGFGDCGHGGFDGGGGHH
jgi:hypothetical protein